MPNRIIKESICTSEKIAALSDFEFRLWIGLITQADDAGRGDARPAIIKGHVFPLRDQVTAKAISAGLHALATVQLVSLYTVGGKPIYWLPGWSEHQRIRDCKPKYPAPEEADDTSPQPVATCGNSPQTAAHGGSRGRESESESNPNPNPNTKESALTRHAHGQYGWVKLTDDEYSRLIADLGEEETKRCITYVDESAQSTGNKNRWKDWNLTVRKCHRDGWGLNAKRTSSNSSAPKDYTFLNKDLANLDNLMEKI